MRNFSAAGLIIAFLAVPGLAADPPSERKAKDPDKIVCKTDRTTGSMIASRICKKRSEWEQEKFQAQELMDDRNRTARESPIPRVGG